MDRLLSLRDGAVPFSFQPGDGPGVTGFWSWWERSNIFFEFSVKAPEE